MDQSFNFVSYVLDPKTKLKILNSPDFTILQMLQKTQGTIFQKNAIANLGLVYRKYFISPNFCGKKKGTKTSQKFSKNDEKQFSIYCVCKKIGDFICSSIVLLYLTIIHIFIYVFLLC